VSGWSHPIRRDSEKWAVGGGRIQLSLRRNCLVLGLGFLGLSPGQWSLVAGINSGAKWHELRLSDDH